MLSCLYKAFAELIKHSVIEIQAHDHATRSHPTHGNALLAHFVFKVTAMVPIGGMLLAVLVVTGITLLTGLLSARGVTDHPPLEILRQET